MPASSLSTPIIVMTRNAWPSQRVSGGLRPGHGLGIFRGLKERLENHHADQAEKYLRDDPCQRGGAVLQQHPKARG